MPTMPTARKAAPKRKVFQRAVPMRPQLKDMYRRRPARKRLSA